MRQRGGNQGGVGICYFTKFAFAAVATRAEALLPGKWLADGKWRINPFFFFFFASARANFWFCFSKLN